MDDPSMKGLEQDNYNPSGAPTYAYSGVCGMGMHYICDAEGRKTDTIHPIPEPYRSTNPAR